jgi:hypothetical protein
MISLGATASKALWSAYLLLINSSGALNIWFAPREKGFTPAIALNTFILDDCGEIMAEISKQVGNRIKWARFVASSAKVNAPDLKETFKEKYGGFGGFAAGIFITIFTLIAARLTSMTDKMESAELKLSDELSDDDAPRDLRDESAEQLRQMLFKARATVEGGFGEEVSRAYGLSDTPPRQPDKLQAFARNSIFLLRENARSEAGAFGNFTDTLKIAEVLEASYDTLADALGAVDTETREAHAARNARDEVVEEWVVVYRGTANALSGLFELAGRQDLADRVRPTVQSAEGKTEPPAIDEAAEAPADADAPVEA